MSRQTLEPGLLPLFKLFMVLRLALVLLTMMFYLSWSRSVEFWQLIAILAFLADIPFLFLYLSWSWFQRRLGRFYLPLALLVATVSPIFEMNYVFPLYGLDAALAFLLMFLLLLVPLILTAWQYPFRYVVLFSLGTSLLEFSLLSGTPQLQLLGIRWAAIAMFGRSLLSIFVGYIVSYLVTEQRKQRQALAQANQKLVRYAAALEQLTTSRERNRLARELHDTLAHALSGLAVQLEALSTVWQPIPPRAQQMLDRALSITRIGLDETRRALQDLRATPLEDMGLALAVREMAVNMAERSTWSLSLNVQEPLPAVPPEVEQCFYRVAQEAMENIHRHAQAQRVTVHLAHKSGQLVLEISDDGQGISDPPPAAADRFGLQGMQERADMIGGHLQVQSQPGQGTTIRLCSGAC